MLMDASLRRALRQAAPQLSKRFFTCQARNVQLSSTTRHTRHSSQLPSTFCNHFRSPGRVQFPSPLQHVTKRTFRTNHRLLQDLAADLKTASNSSTTDSLTSTSRWPETSSNAVAKWLLLSAASVFGIVVFGGLTRLTESGLSITEWRPVAGSVPPYNDDMWQSEYDKYRASPEFQVLNSKMTLDEFKFIYYMEWIHRLWGRFVGLSFVLPAAYFVTRRRVAPRDAAKLLGIASLIGFQGFLGWWMVKSGLKDDFLKPDKKPGRDVPRVSQYRLAAHLGTAFVAYLSMVWVGLDILRTNKLVHPTANASTREATSASLYALRNPMLKPFKIATALLLGLTFTTAMSGALVAGLDAGLIYNEFPYMGLGLTPPKSELFDPFYSHTQPNEQGRHADLVWRNMLENPSLVQLDHRILATSTFTAVMGLYAWTKMSKQLQMFLPKNVKAGVTGVVGFVWMQVILGISTLIYMVPVPIASAHQAGALALLTWVTVLGSRVWMPRAAVRILQQRAAATGNSSQMPGIEKVKANRGDGFAVGNGMPVLQASAAAIAAAGGSLLLAGRIEEGRGERRLEEKRALGMEQVEFLRRMQSGVLDSRAGAPNRQN